MAFTKTWSEADLGSTNQNDIDDLVEDTRYAVRERAAVEHTTYADESGHSDVWRHSKTASRTNAGLAANKPTTAATGMVDGARYRETDTGLIKYYDVATLAWITETSDRHSGITTTYTTGTISVTNASAVVTGAGTSWTGNVAAGDTLKGPDAEYYTIASVDSTTQITLNRTYDGTTVSGQTYTIYLDGHPAYLPKGGGTVNGAVTVDGALTVGGAFAFTGALDMGSEKITSLAAATANGDAVRYEQVVGVYQPVGTYGQVMTGHYTGNGASSRAITGVGFQPKILKVYAQTSASSVTTTDQDGGYIKQEADGSWVTGVIDSLDADGFTVTSNANVNANGVVYTWIAWG